MDPWYKVVEPRKEVREGRSFNPDEFAIHLEQVVGGSAPEDYREPEKFFARTCFTRALTEHAGMVLRRLSGETANTAPVLTLVTQFGGGKTHTLTVLYHLAHKGDKAKAFAGIAGLLEAAHLGSVPKAKVAVFVGNAWDPQSGRETPWIDIAAQLAGDAGVALLGPTAKTTPPGTEALAKVFAAAGGTVLILCDEVLNFVNRHRNLADPFHAFIQNLTVAMTGTSRGAAVISLPRSQTEMTEYDMAWQEKITKVVRRVSKDLIVNDEGEIAEVIRRRLFDDLPKEKERIRRKVAKEYSDWCFERRNQLPPEWTAVDSAATEAGAREFLLGRFEACYPFHPATISVFQRKWQALPQYQQTRGTLAMLAQWISWAYRDGFASARREPLVTLGSAPLEVRDFSSVVLGQLGEPRLGAAIETDIAGKRSHARALDADTAGPLKDIHRRVATAILFESSGGQVEKLAHLPELRFAIGEPEVDTTSVDNAALALEAKAFFVRKVGSDGFKIGYKPTLKKVVNDRRNSLDKDRDIAPAMTALIKAEFEKAKTIPLILLPKDGTEVQDSPRLTIVVAEPATEWDGGSEDRARLAEWTRKRGTADRLYPGSLVWCAKKPGRELHERVTTWLAWRAAKREIDEGTLGGDFERADLADLSAKLKDAEESARDEVWASYRYVILSDPQEPDGLRVIDLGAGHASSGETLTGRIVSALKSSSLLNESVGAGYLDRNWPPALKETGAWPLKSLRQSFLNGALTRLLDPDSVLRGKIVEFVGRGDFGLASGSRPDGSFERVWFNEMISGDEVSFDADVYLLTKARAVKLSTTPLPGPEPGPGVVPPMPPKPGVEPQPPIEPPEGAEQVTVRLRGPIAPELWNRVGTKLIPKLRQGKGLAVSADFSVRLDSDQAKHLIPELQQILQDLGLDGEWKVEQ